MSAGVPKKEPSYIHMGENIRSPSTEPHADGRPTYSGVRPGSPQGGARVTGHKVLLNYFEFVHPRCVCKIIMGNVQSNTTSCVWLNITHNNSVKLDCDCGYV
jgi:hypothetical protein